MTRPDPQKIGWLDLLIAFALLAVALVIVFGLPSPGEPHGPSAPPYRRTDWGGFIDANGNCRNTRQEVLIRDSGRPVLFRNGGCEVAWGEWVDPYTGETINDPTKLDVDHVVPLEEVHRSGGAAWPQERKRAYANGLSYRFHLLAVSLKANRSKGSRGPDRWRPPRREFHCRYAEIYASVKAVHGLRITAAERLALAEMLATC